MNIQDISKDLLKTVSDLIEKKTVKEVDEPKAKGEKDFKDLHLKDLEVYTEKLDPEADASEWIEDFMKSDAPQFKGKTKEERKDMALAAYYAARKKAGLEEGADKDVKGSGEGVVESKQKVLKAMIKGGSNPKEAESLIKKYFSYVAKTYSDVTPAKKAEIIVTLAATESTDLEEATDPDKELASWLRKRLAKNRPGDRDLRKELEKLLKKLEEGADSDVKGDKEEYQKFFQGMLKKFGVKSPAELSGDKEKEFYDAIDAGWKADDEKKESIEEMKEPFIVIDTADNNKVVATASDEKGAERIISSSERPPISIKDKKTLKVVKSNKKQDVGFPLKETLDEEESI
jgi:hypothetical protein